jgi:hypothetical protein
MSCMWIDSDSHIGGIGEAAGRDEKIDFTVGVYSSLHEYDLDTKSIQAACPITVSRSHGFIVLS